MKDKALELSLAAFLLKTIADVRDGYKRDTLNKNH